MKGAALQNPGAAGAGSGGKGGPKGGGAKGGKGAKGKDTSQTPGKRTTSTEPTRAKDPDLCNSAGKLMCYAHYEGRCSKTPEECGKSHGAPTARQLVKYKEHKARMKDRQTSAERPTADKKPGASPKALPAPIPDAGGTATKEKRRRSRGRSKSKGNTPGATPGVVAVPIPGLPGGTAAVASTSTTTSR